MLECMYVCMCVSISVASGRFNGPHSSLWRALGGQTVFDRRVLLLSSHATWQKDIGPPTSIPFRKWSVGKGAAERRDGVVIGPWPPPLFAAESVSLDYCVLTVGTRPTVAVHRLGGALRFQVVTTERPGEEGG